MMIQFKTDPGRVRSSNQDAITAFTLEDGLFAAVCDGMGGAKGGNVASGLCARTLAEYVQSHYHTGLSPDEAAQLLNTAMDRANGAVYEWATDHPELTGMGTTAVAALVRAKQLILANVGDSRAVLYRADELTQLTRDHSYVQAMVDSGKLTPEQAETHPQKNIITRAVGIANRVETDTFAYELEPGDMLLLCSDGLTNELSYDAMAALIRATPREKLADVLIDKANEHGGHDNSTVVLVEN